MRNATDKHHAFSRQVVTLQLCSDMCNMSSYRSVDHTSDSAVTVEQLDHIGTSVTRQQLPISAYVDTDREIQAIRCIGLSAKAAQELGLHCNQTMPREQHSVPTKSKQPEKALQFQKIKH